MIVVVMGVSGVGKTTLGRLLAQRLGCAFLDGDDFHPTANVARMAAGIPLTDADRAPWLDGLNALLRERAARGEDAVVACSALKAAYRERLLRDIPEGRLVYLHADKKLIASRLGTRSHRYMPPTLLDSQFDTLEAPANAIAVDVTDDLDRCLARMVTALSDR